MPLELVFFHFCFLASIILLSIVLSVSFLMVVVSSPSCFSMLSSSRGIDASTFTLIPTSHLLPTFLDTYILSTSSLGCNALCLVISFLVLWFICLCSMFHFKMGPEYLTRDRAQEFIPLISFLFESFASSSSRYSLIFSFISTYLMVSTSKMPKYLHVSSKMPKYLHVTFSLTVLNLVLI